MEENLTDTSIKDIYRLNSEGNNQSNNSLSIIDNKKNIFLLKNYYNNSYRLENQALRNSFGKMVKSVNDTSPKFSFGKEKRFYQDFKKDDVNYYTKIFNQIKTPTNGNVSHRSLRYKNFQTPENYLNKVKAINLSQGVKCPTDFLYYPPPTNIYKYPFLPKFSFGKGLRDLQKPIKLYEHYKKCYDRKTDEENVDKKWRKRIVGGDIGLEGRFTEDKKLFYESQSPGPGRYNPNYNFFKFSQNKYGYMGIKFNDNHYTINTDRPKHISLDAFNMKHLLGNYNKNVDNKNMNKDIRFKFFKKEAKNNNAKEIKKIQFIKLRKLFEDKKNQHNIAKTNISYHT